MIISFCLLKARKYSGKRRKCWLTLSHTIPTFNDPVKEPFENIMGKGENAGNQPFLLFPFFLPLPPNHSYFQHEIFCRLPMLLTQDSVKFLSFDKELTAVQVFQKHCGKRRNCS